MAGSNHEVPSSLYNILPPLYFLPNQVIIICSAPPYISQSGRIEKWVIVTPPPPRK